METAAYILAALAQIAVAAALVFAVYWSRDNVIPALWTIAERAGNEGGTGAADLAEIRREIAALTRRVEDVDEASDRRYRKLTARDRRERAAEAPADEETDDFGAAAPAFFTPQPAEGNGRRKLRNPNRRR